VIQFDMSRATLKRSVPLERHVVLYNGVPIPGAEHASKRDALVAAWQLAKACSTAIENFRVLQVTK
jgi:hypothetical protein